MIKIVKKAFILSLLTTYTAYADSQQCLAQEEQRYSANSIGQLTLNLDNCDASGQGLKVLISSMADKHLSQVTRLSLKNNKLNDDDADYITSLAIKYDFTDHSLFFPSFALDISHNQLSQEGGNLIVQIPGLDEINLSHNSLGTHSTDMLSRPGLKVQKIVLDDNPLVSSEINLFLNNTHSAEISLAHAGLTDSSVNQYPINSTVKKLALGFNKITDHGCSNLANNVLIEVLDLSGNPITDSCVQSLRAQNKLKELHIDAVKISNLSLRILIYFTSLQTLSLNDDHLDDSEIKILAASTNLKSLSLESNQIGSIGAITLANNTSIFSLDLKNNHISDTGASALATRHFDVLDVSNNNIGKQGMDVLQAASARGDIKLLIADGNPGLGK